MYLFNLCKSLRKKCKRPLKVLSFTEHPSRRPGFVKDYAGLLWMSELTTVILILKPARPELVEGSNGRAIKKEF